MHEPPRAGVLVTRRFPGYKDVPGSLYHYPRAKYEAAVERLLGSLVLIYEPRRGGMAADAMHGGRSAFVAFAFADHSLPDPDDETHAYLSLKYYLDFTTVVPIASTSVDGHSLQSAVKEVPYDEAERIVTEGLAVPTSSSNAPRFGLIDTEVLAEVANRTVKQVTRNLTIRDASFRFRVVEQGYGGRCALTGVRMTNGHGRAEADAAHIRPVEEGGPDTIRNGMALMKTLHWAFDRGLVTISEADRILTVDRGIDDQIRKLLPANGVPFLPAEPNDRPHPAFLAWHREHKFKGAA